MRYRVFFTSIAMVVATAAFAHDGVKNPAVIARMEAMEDSGKALEVIGNMVKGKTAFDAAQAAAARTALIDATSSYEALFSAEETDPKSKARAEIWSNMDDFNKHAQAAVTAAKALDTSSAEAMGAGMGPIGGACGSCHKSYRAK